MIWSYGYSRPELFCKKSVFKNIAKFTGKKLCCSPYFHQKKVHKNIEIVLLKYIKTEKEIFSESNKN